MRRARTVLLVLFVGTFFASTAAAQPVKRVEYYHLDALGSVRAVTDQQGHEIARHDYMPFGEEWPQTTFTLTPLFAGKQRDAENALDYVAARYYASRTGRFTTVDPVLNVEPALFNPQRWNRYAYAGNNPLRFVDPDGEDFWDFVNGVSDAMRANFALGIGRSTGGNSDFVVGQRVGDLISLAGSAIETIGGFETMSGGVAACGTGVGCLAGAPAIAGGAVLTSHGVGMGAAASISLMSGTGSRGGGTRTDSKTLFNKEGVRVDVENPAPDRRPGQVHVQLGREKYIYDPATQSFKNAPPRIQRLLEREDIRRAIEKGLRYLGQEPK